MSPSGESPLEQLAAKSGRDFPNLLEARRRTASGLEERRARLAELTHDSDVSIVLMGSWGRAEVTAGSDDDFMVLVDGPQREETQPPIEAVKNVLDRRRATRASSATRCRATGWWKTSGWIETTTPT